MGNVWVPTAERNWHPTGAHQMDYYERVQASLENIVEAWRVRRSGRPGDYTVPHEPDEYEATIGPALEAVETDRAYRRHGTRGARPYVSPDDADCLSSEDLEAFDVIDWTARFERAEQRAVASLRASAKQAGLEAFCEGATA